ncbi:hypothetical protein B7P43_G04927 [Cryptotermes secundus]|uniref:Uncharacterized protein n=1 Tax=Cryptotermes secundus TaxID=105785 RepID=A0A2J7RNC0_9NEOP|nr:hypothetical protein B7P43_G04927 [Cryptotermes secundus]
MTERLEQRYCNMFCQKLGDTQAETIRKIQQAFGDDAIGKFVPMLLSPEQQQLRLEVAQQMLECANRDPEFVKTVITGNESWVYRYDPETKVQVSKWKHPTSQRPKRARQVRNNVKVILTVFLRLPGC